MKRKFAFLTTLGVLAALAVPASSMGASMVPAGHKFEIQGLAGSIPKLSTSLGSCSISKITSSIPAAPANEASFNSAATVTAGSCSAGTTISINGSWTYTFQGNFYTHIGSTNTEAVVMRFASLPGCKLAGAYKITGLWSNGIGGTQSGFHGESGNGLTWANDGGSCALAGKVEGVSYEARGGTSPNYTLVANFVNDLTAPGTLVLMK